MGRVFEDVLFFVGVVVVGKSAPIPEMPNPRTGRPGW